MDGTTKIKIAEMPPNIGKDQIKINKENLIRVEIFFLDKTNAVAIKSIIMPLIIIKLNNQIGVTKSIFYYF